MAAVDKRAQRHDCRAYTPKNAEASLARLNDHWAETPGLTDREAFNAFFADAVAEYDAGRKPSRRIGADYYDNLSKQKAKGSGGERILLEEISLGAGDHASVGVTDDSFDGDVWEGLKDAAELDARAEEVERAEAEADETRAAAERDAAETRREAQRAAVEGFERQKTVEDYLPEYGTKSNALVACLTEQVKAQRAGEEPPTVHVPGTRELAEQRAALERQAAALMARENALGEREGEVDERERAVDAARADVERRERAVGTAEADVERELAGRRAKVRRLNDEIASKGARVERIDAEIEAKGAESKRLDEANEADAERTRERARVEREEALRGLTDRAEERIAGFLNRVVGDVGYIAYRTLSVMVEMGVGGERFASAARVCMDVINAMSEDAIGRPFSQTTAGHVQERVARSFARAFARDARRDAAVREVDDAPQAGRSRDDGPGL